MITGIGIKNKLLNQQINQQIRPQKKWQQLLAEAIRDPSQLFDQLDLPTTGIDQTLQATGKFNLLVTQSYLNKMQKGAFSDPLLMQVLPVANELTSVSGYSADPVCDQNYRIADGLLQKYHGRALVVSTGACAIHCRYCFRREFPYSDANASKNDWQAAVKAVANDPQISEVILSGGDPLVLSDEKLASLCFQLSEIPHVKTLRFHSRVPIVLPERIDHDFLSWFQHLSVKKVVVIHSNHPNELDEMVGKSLSALHSIDTMLLNQSVLLKGVNDNLETLENLSRKLWENDTLPYYLHLLDKVSGAAHFDVQENIALGLLDELRGKLPGYLVPKLVREVSGKRSKTPIV